MHGGTGLGIELNPPNRISRPPCANRPSGAGKRIAKAGGTVRVMNAKVGSDEHPQTLVAMRSAKGMAGLLLAEVGGSMVEIDKHAGGLGSSFREGRPIEPGAITPIAGENAALLPGSARGSKVQSRLRIEHRRGSSLDQGLARHGTLLSAQASPTRRAAELKVLLGDSSAKVKSGAVVSSLQGSKKSPNAVAFEQGRSRVRVALDLVLENSTVVEGGYLSGSVLLRVRPKAKRDVLSLGGGKIRIAGFEIAPGNANRHIFYQVAAPLTDISDGCDGLYTSPVDKEGFGQVREGEYCVRFSLKLPVISTGGKPKGVMTSRSGATIRYIIISSMKVVDPATGKRSIAHFYRDCEIWPALDPAATLAPSPQPVCARSAKKLFMGGDGLLALTASLHRITWVAGQPVHVRLRVTNDTRKTVRSVTLALVRTTTLFRPSAHAAGFGGDPDACETETSERRVADSVLAAGQKGTKGHASAKGWWTGVAPGETAVVGHCITIPPDALTISRARLIEVEYALRVSLGVGSIAGNSDAVHVTLPIRVVNFISLDPPPSDPVSFSSSSSVIELNTPRPADSAIEASKLRTRGQASRLARPSASSSSRRISADTRMEGVGLPGSGDAFDHVRFDPGFQAHREVPLPSLPTAHTLHDLGAVEDAEDLHGVLGEIPWSASLLEESDITVDSGYSDGDGGEFGDECGYGLADEDSGEFGYEEYGSDDGEDRHSDEELEKIVDCASARPEAGAFQLSESSTRYGSPKRTRGHTRSELDTSDAEYAHVIDNLRHERACKDSQVKLRMEGAYGAQAPRELAVGQDLQDQRQNASIHRHKFAELVHERKCALQASSDRQKPEQLQTIYATRSMLHVPDKPSRLLDESPGSVYSTKTPAAKTLHAPPTRGLDDSPSKILMRTQIQGPRPPVSRTSTAPASASRGLLDDSSFFSSSPSRINVSGAPVSNTAAAGGGGTSSVRARIAMLEQKTREQDEHLSLETSTSRPVVASRSMTTGSLPAFSYREEGK